MTEVEHALIEASKKGDVEAFNQLVRMYESRVFNLAYRMLGDRDAAADIAQETFISAYRAIRRFRDGSFTGWIMRIATNACYDLLRKYKRKPTTSLDAMTNPTDDSPPKEWATDSADLDSQMITRELGAQIQEGLMSLPDDQRIVLIMCDIQGYSYEEIAEAVDTQLGTVKSRLSRGRAKLRDYLKERELLPAKYRS